MIPLDQGGGGYRYQVVNIQLKTILCRFPANTIVKFIFG
jgi:hypothetical protein